MTENFFFYLNGQRIEPVVPDPTISLLTFLRSVISLVHSYLPLKPLDLQEPSQDATKVVVVPALFRWLSTPDTNTVLCMIFSVLFNTDI